MKSLPTIPSHRDPSMTFQSVVLRDTYDNGFLSGQLARTSDHDQRVAALDHAVRVCGNTLDAGPVLTAAWAFLAFLRAPADAATVRVRRRHRRHRATVAKSQRKRRAGK